MATIQFPEGVTFLDLYEPEISPIVQKAIDDLGEEARRIIEETIGVPPGTLEETF
jgi:hypothetical protein